MNFLSLIFLLYIFVFVGIYFIVPARYRYIVFFLGNYIFYGSGHWKMLITLAVVTAISYFGGLIIEKERSKAAYIGTFVLEISILLIFKYTGFFFMNYNLLTKILGINSNLNFEWNVLLPAGLSFIIFQTSMYLTEVYQGKISAEKNIVRYASFAAFFPTLLSGPIQKASNLLPQIKEAKDFDFEQAQKGTLLFIWGAFVKIIVANNLGLVVVGILNEHAKHSSMEVLLAACCFSLYIYADFSSYSDMARGISKLLNIDVGKNFNNPYISQSTSEFWNRWHISLNAWFLENVYIPLGGNRKGIMRKYINMLVVFLISGLWHGPQWHFIIWGFLNWVLVVIGLILKPVKQKLYQQLQISEELESIVFLKRFIVFGLITMTWMFFNSGILDALLICRKILMFDFASIFDPELVNIGGTATTTFTLLLATALFCIVQNLRRNEAYAYSRYKAQPFFFQCLIVAVFICICIFGICNTDAIIDTDFIYFQF